MRSSWRGQGFAASWIACASIGEKTHDGHSAARLLGSGLAAACAVFLLCCRGEELLELLLLIA
ncbi:MAG: hypothetical protein HY703_03795 [Gemmatimonadetes bacterium]|nr:hypothetical protein [Gemmatimonadota bacterium]